MSNVNNHEVVVIIQLELNRKIKPPCGPFKIVPKMNKTEYESMRKQLLKWEKNPGKLSAFSRILLNPTVPIFNGVWEMSSESFYNSFMSGMDKLRVRRLYDGLNFEQVNKFKKTCAIYFEYFHNCNSRFR